MGCTSAQSASKYQTASCHDRPVNVTPADRRRLEIKARANALYMMGELALAAQLLLQLTLAPEPKFNSRVR
jgi:hypothetical protein